jgi:threonine dehydrogenase-like Zn-dependent dehydrogenase
VTVATATMAAALLIGGRRVDAVRAPPPVPGAGEVLIRVEGCGVCGSSLPVWEGRDWFAYPLEPGAPGHEVWGELDDGRRAVALCARGYAEFDVADADTVVALPPELDGLPFPGEALACAVNVARRAAPAPDARIAVVGMGFLGTAVARLLGDVTELRRHTPVQGEFDVVVEATGTQSGLDTASRLVATGGRLVLAGFHQDGLRTVDLQSWNWRGIDVVNAHERDPATYVDGMRTAVQLAADGVLDVERLVTHRFPLANVEQAFAAAAARPAGFLKAVVCP